MSLPPSSVTKRASPSLWFQFDRKKIFAYYSKTLRPLETDIRRRLMLRSEAPEKFFSERRIAAGAHWLVQSESGHRRNAVS